MNSKLRLTYARDNRGPPAKAGRERQERKLSLKDTAAPDKTGDLLPFQRNVSHSDAVWTEEH